MLNEGLVQKIGCLVWAQDTEVRKYAEAAVKEFVAAKQMPLGPPSLVEIVLWKLRHTLYRKKVSREVLACCPATLAERLKEARKRKGK